MQSLCIAWMPRLGAARGAGMHVTHATLSSCLCFMLLLYVACTTFIWPDASAMCMQLLRSGSPCSLDMEFADGKAERMDITDLNSRQVFNHIKSRIEEKDMASVLAQNQFMGKTLTSRWGVRKPGEV